MRMLLGLTLTGVLLASNSTDSSAMQARPHFKGMATTKTSKVSTSFVATYANDGSISCGGSPTYFYNAAMTPSQSVSPPKFLCGYYLSPQSGPYTFNGGTISVKTSVQLADLWGVQLSGPCSTGTCTVVLTSSQPSAAIPTFTNGPTLAISAQSNAAFTLTVTLST